MIGRIAGDQPGVVPFKCRSASDHGFKVWNYPKEPPERLGRPNPRSAPDREPKQGQPGEGVRGLAGQHRLHPAHEDIAGATEAGVKNGPERS